MAYGDTRTGNEAHGLGSFIAAIFYGLGEVFRNASHSSQGQSAGLFKNLASLFDAVANPFNPAVSPLRHSFGRATHRVSEAAHEVSDSIVRTAHRTSRSIRSAKAVVENAASEAGEHIAHSPIGRAVTAALNYSPLSAPSRIMDEFRIRGVHPVSGKPNSKHRGFDLRAEVGTPVHAIADATVRFAGSMNGFGNTLILDYGNGVVSLDAHLDKFGKNVKKGRHVDAGDIVARSGRTGRVTAEHLHREVGVLGDDGLYHNIDPEFATIAELRVSPALRREAIADASEKFGSRKATVSNVFTKFVHPSRDVPAHRGEFSVASGGKEHHKDHGRRDLHRGQLLPAFVVAPV